MIVIHVNSEALRRELGDLASKVVRPRAILQTAARVTRREMQRHFRDRNKTPNKLGGRRTNFWLDILRSTQIGRVTDSEGQVLVGDHRFALRVYGGEIRAKVARYLTIPVTAEAHGRRAEVMERETGIKLVFLKRGSGAILYERQGKDIKVHYVLKRSVNQEADPEAMPDRAALESAVRIGAERHVDLMIRRAGKAPRGGAS